MAEYIPLKCIKNVNLRSSPSASSTLKGSVSAGFTVNGNYYEDGWVGFIYNGSQVYSAVTSAGYTYWEVGSWVTEPNPVTNYSVKIYALNSSRNYTLAETFTVAGGSSFSVPYYYDYCGDDTAYYVPYDESYSTTITFNKNETSSSKTTTTKTVYYSRYYFPCGYSTSKPNDPTDGGDVANKFYGDSITINSNVNLYLVFSSSVDASTPNIRATTNYPGWTNVSSTTTYTAKFYEDGINTQSLSRNISYGKKFLGWSKTRTGSVIKDSTFTSKTTLYAKWSTTETDVVSDSGNITLPSLVNNKSSVSNKYTINFNTNSDKSLESKYAGSINYTFIGWYDGTGSSSSKYGDTGDGLELNGNIDIYARWTENISDGSIILPTPTKSIVPGTTYQVTIDPDNGDSVNTLSVAVGKKTYSFDGWYEDSSLSTFAGNAGSSYNVASSKTLYAKWIETITNGTNISNPNDKPSSIEDVTTIIDFCTDTLENYELTSNRTVSYTFAGWYNGNTKVTNLTPYIPTADVTLKAKWNTSTTYSEVSIPTDKFRREYEEMEVVLHNNYGEDLTDVYTEEKTVIYNFLGIFTAQSGGSNVDPSRTGYYTPSSISTTLYAHWEVDSSYVNTITLYDASRDRIDGKEYLVYYNGNGGDPERGSDVIVRGRTEYTFTGWYDSATGGNKIASPYKPVKPSIDFYAHWTETNTNEQVKLPGVIRENSEGTNVTVTFDADGGIVLGNSSADKTISVGGKRYTFKGWYDKSSNGTQIGFTGDNYYPSDSDDPIINLYANWDEDIDNGTIDLPIPTKQDIKEYNVLLDAGEGLIGDSNTRSLLARQGTLYKFNGWYDGATKIESPYSPTYNITLKAGWLIDSNVNEPITFETPVFNTSKSININLYENKSTSDTTKTVKTANKITKKDFKGWYLDNERLDASSNTYMPSRDNIIIMARWDNAKCDPITIDDISRATEKKNYTINLNSNGGTIDNGVSSLSASRSTEYGFTGWYEARGGNNTMTDSNKQYTPDPDSTDTEINMYAHWKATPSTVRADLPGATMNGYTHLGWSTDKTKQNIVASPYVPASIDMEAVTLYAIYTYKGKIKINGKYYMPIVYLGGKWYKLLPEVFKNGTYRESGYKE